MKFLIQRVKEAQVQVDHAVIGQISRGFLVFVGISSTDTRELADQMIRKLAGLRIFPDENGKINLDIHSIGGELLLISQFTLYADCRKGNRPSFTQAGPPDMAEELYHYIVEKCKEVFPRVQEGCFGADMKVFLQNDGPFTIMLDSQECLPAEKKPPAANH